MESQGLRSEWEDNVIQDFRKLVNGTTIKEYVQSIKETIKEANEWINSLKEGSESVKDEQRNGDGVVDGNRPAQFNKDATVEGGGDSKEVKTSSESNMKVENPDKPSAEVKIDTLWGNIRTHNNADNDSTTTYQEYKTSDGQEGEKVIKKEKGSTGWL